MALTRPTLFGRDITHIHCVGVGGMGVGPLAIYLVAVGFTVSGEDDAMSEDMRGQLARAGVQIGTMPKDIQLVAYSSAISPTHPTYAAAVAAGVPLVRRGELLAEAVRGRKLVAICGSHGKTSTTAMLVHVLRQVHFSAGYILGGLFGDDTPPAAAGENDWVVAEIDESDGTIERFSPQVTVAVNLDWDHPDHYRRREDIDAAFAALFARTAGEVLVGEDRLNVGGVPSPRGIGVLESGVRAPRPQLTFGQNGDFSFSIVEEKGDSLALRLGGRFRVPTAAVRARGEFNAANACAALATAELMGAALRSDVLAAYPAVKRRQSVLRAGEYTVLEDYAHHPTEIRALLASLRSRLSPTGKLRVIFQPHRFTRTAQFKAEFAEALSPADDLYLLDVYAASESPATGGTTQDLLTEIQRRTSGKSPSYVGGDDRAFFGPLSAAVRPGDLVAFVGAGDIDKRAREWLEQLKTEGSGRRADGHTAKLTVGMTAATCDAFVADLRPKLSAATKLTREEPLANKTTMRVGGAARVYVEPASLEDLQTVLRETRTAALPVFVLGRGSNLLIPDEGVDGIVLSLGHEAWARFEPQADGRVRVGAGLRLKNLCGLAAKAGLGGFEFLEGIPGNVGGALRMNAGAMGGWMFDVVEEVTLVNLEGEFRTLPKSAMHVDYRHCAELHDAIALGALLRPASAAPGDEVKRQMDAYARKRHESQPREPSAGCIFKNPPGSSAGRLIDECGLKGLRVGDAEVSPVHANFIVNVGKARSADVIELVRQIRTKVRAAKGVDLQPEVLLYGKRWEEVL